MRLEPACRQAKASFQAPHATLQAAPIPADGPNVSNDLVELVSGVLGRAPEWVRGDLASKDDGIRRRAEETLAAMITAALETQDRA